jgi:uncharacterized membrane protein
MNKKILSLAELKAKRKPLKNANDEREKSLSRLERLALWITTHVGTMGFFLIIFTWTILWLGWNLLAPKEFKFDPYPAFAFWLFISNMIQIFLMPLIMIGQNLQAKHSELRAQIDFDVNKKAEKEIEIIIQHLEKHSQLLEEILKNKNA